jgi:ankyrin repeat protein
MDGGNWKEMFNAACAGDLELVRWHVQHGVDVDYAHPEFLSTALVACTLAGREEVALYLLQAGANPNLHSEFDAMTPLQAAQQAGLERLQAHLRALGATLPMAAQAPAAAPQPGLWARLRGLWP